MTDPAKGDRWFQVVRNKDFKIARRWDMGKELEEAGYKNMSSAVRPMAISPDERFVYYQVSFFHGFVEFDLKAKDPTGGGDYTVGDKQEPATGKVTRIIPLPNRVPDMPREQYVLDSAHHGLAMNDKGTKICAAGTMDDYAAIVTRRTMKFTILDGKGDAEDRKYLKPYWATDGPSNTCWMSMSGNDAVAVIDLHKKREIAWVKVGDHPQRVRQGTVAASVAGTMDDYAAIVTRRTMKFTILDGKGTADDRKYLKPYWSTDGPSNTCWMSMSGNDAVAVIDLHKKREIAWVEVGDHPQRIRQGAVAASVHRDWRS